MGYDVKQSTTAYPLVFLMIDSTDHLSAKTGLSPTVTLSKAGAAFGAPAGAVTEIANGWYKVAGNATDSNTLGPLILHATATGADASDELYNIVAYDPQDAVRLGLTALPNAAAEAPGGLYTRGTGAGQINQPANGMIDGNVVRWLGTAASTPTVAGVPNVNVKTWNDLATVALPLIPTTAGRTLDVSLGGEAGVDWANVGTPGSTVSLSATTVSNVTLAAATTTLTNAPSDSAGVTTLLSRLSAARAGYLDVLNGIVAAIWAAVADSPGVTTLLARVGAFTGTGVNTVLGLLKAALSKTATTPSDVGGTFDPSTDSNEAIRDNMSSGGGGGSVIE